MKNRILAVCDPEEAYVGRLMEYLNERQVSPFYVRAFSSRKALEDFLGQEEIEVLLISADMAAEDMEGLYTGRKILLTKGQVPKGLEEEPAIYKYQSAEKIIREALYYYAEEAQPFLQAALLKKEVRLYGVYSPVGRVGKTAFSLALGAVCGRKRKTLYLNLEPYSGFEQLFVTDCEWNLGDLLYFLKKGKQGFLFKLKSMTLGFGNLDYISPVRSPEDLLSVTEEEWEVLLERLVTDAGYECLILDFSDCIQGMAELLGRCGRIYMPVLEDPVSQAKVKQFDKMLDERGFENLREAIQKIRLPKIQNAKTAKGMAGIPDEISRFAEELEDW